MQNIEAETSAMVFRACATALLALDLSIDQARIAAQAFREVEMCSRLATLLDGLAPAVIEQKQEGKYGSQSVPPKLSRSNATTSPKVSATVSPDVLFDTLKRRKITKSHLFSLFQQISPDEFSLQEEELSMREALRLFKKVSSEDDWELLAGVIQGAIDVDPFLARMTERRL